MNLTESIDAPVGDYVVADHQQGAGAPAAVWTKDNQLYFQLSTMGDVRLYFASLEGKCTQHLLKMSIFMAMTYRLTVSLRSLQSVMP